jgi:hypothetical protein
MMVRELAVEEVEAEVSSIEVRLILGASTGADLDRYLVLKASRQYLSRELVHARHLLDTLDDELHRMIGDLAQAHLVEIEVALSRASTLTETGSYGPLTE